MSWLSQLPADVKKKLGYAAALVGLGVIFGWSFRGCLAPIVGEQTPVEPPVVQTPAMGWVDRPDHVKQTVEGFRHPYFGDIAKGIIQQDVDKDALLYKVYEKVTGREWRPHDQNGVGSCVGQGAAGATEVLITTQIAAGENDHYEHISAAAIYAAARKVDGMLRGGDGATGAGAAKAMMEFGHISCKDAGDDNFDTSIGSKLCKAWGRSGVPDQFHKFARKVQTASRVRTPEECRSAVVNGYPVTIASSVGFEGKGGHKRDADGFCYSGGTWAHQMFVMAYRADKKAFLLANSWGPRMPEGPKSLDQPDGTFWITWKDMQRITTSGECYAISGFDGFPRQNIDVFIAKPMPRRDYAIVPVPMRRFLEYPLAP